MSSFMSVGVSSTWIGNMVERSSADHCGSAFLARRFFLSRLEVRTQVEALRIAERYGYSIFDSCILASALEAGSDTLWSEDMQHGMVIDDRLRIANPFRTES